MQLVLHPCDPFLINYPNITDNSVERHCFVMLNVILQVKLDSKRFIEF